MKEISVFIRTDDLTQVTEIPVGKGAHHPKRRYST
jgi:hypothetical protein